ncbi:3-oxoacyl-ACP reductase FabG [Alkalihalobacillus oceani]|uniref:3-oxoacyl-ACP reductase FabG n=1 Tax=Halalkalibacter oceani TaxID=1653776 RepID=A0A9X2DN44_9BACI|nr:3-oxoacyl-ACP reductase family protein [Halalkalibacter oceani]MCM3712995.1 3-oxoacyl-ACP reductase FabG [Halalkalibacter oceani]
MRLQNKVAIITGAGPGIGMGRGFPIGFAKEGANLTLNYYAQDKKKIEDFKIELEKLGAKVNLVEGDISKEQTAKKLVESTIDQFGKIDILLNNAGISSQSLVQDMSVEMWDKMIEVNLRSVFLTTRYVVPHMISQKSGRIINIASQIGHKGGIEHSHYAAAKAGVIGFTKSIALELGHYGITANCIAPGPIETQMMATVNNEWKSNKFKELVIPRFGKVEEVVPTAIFLATDPDGNIYTGQTLNPNCGDIMI